MVLAVDYQMGMSMMDDRDYSEHEAFFQDVLEIARRHKIMNPEKMRTEYAKVWSSDLIRIMRFGPMVLIVFVV